METPLEEVVRELEHELATTRGQLTTTIEDLETANEELKASNEESMAMNEELQSGNQELQTSQEELQSLNEELVTLNNQLERKLYELQETSDDLNNLLVSASMPTVFVDAGFVIRRFTPSCDGLFNFIASDVGRSLKDISGTFNSTKLFEDGAAVLEDLQPRERNITTELGQSFIARTLPYRTDDNRIHGVVFTFADVTKLRESERVARQRLAELETIYAASPVGLSFVDADMRYRSLSVQMAEINGVAIEDSIGHTLGEVLPSPLAEQVTQLHKEVLETGQAILNREVSGRTSGSESTREWLVSYYPVRMDDTQILGVNSVVQDITEQKEMLRQLEESEKRFRRTFENAAVGITHVSPHGNWLRVNDRFCEIVGYSRKELLAGKSQDITHPDDLEDHLAQVNRIRNGEVGSYSIEKRYLRKDNSVVWVNLTVSLVKKTDRSSDYFVAIIEDISANKQAEKELRDSEERFRQIASATDYVFWMTRVDPEELIYVSPAYEKLWGRSIEQLYEDPRLWIEAIHPDDRVRVRQVFDRWIEQPDRREFDIEYRILRPDGEIVWIADRGSVIAAEGEEPLRLTGIARNISVPKTLTLALEENENAFRSVAELMPFGYWETDAKGNLVYISESFLNKVGKTIEECREFGWLDCCDPKDLQPMTEAWKRCVKKKGNWEYEQRFIDHEGNKFGVLSRAIPLRDREGNVTKWVGLNIDISERLEAEQLLQSSYETFFHLVQDAPFGVYLVDSELRLRQASAGSDKVFAGIDPLIGRDLSEVLHILWDEPFASDAVQRFGNTLETGESYCSSDMTEQRHDVEAVESYHWETHRIRLPDGEYGVVCYFFDLTDIKQAESQRRESEQHLRLGAEVAQMGVVSVDYGTDTVSFDDVAADLFDLPQGETVARNEFHERFHSEDRVHFEQLIETAMDTGDEHGVTIEGRVIHGDNSLRWLNIRKRFFFEEVSDGTQHPTHAVLAAVDITDRKEFERALVEARDAAEAANRARGEFLANMSHEIRTPMTAILGHADMLLAHLKDPDNRQCVATMKRSGNHLLELINDILDLSRLEADKLAVESQPCNVTSLLSDIQSLMYPRIREKQIDFDLVADGLLPEVIETDDTRLKQVLFNLVGNAIKFTDEGYVRIRVACVPEKEMIRFAVEDTGIGISEKDKAGLFDAFFQVDASDTRVFGGSGLGLTISQRMTQLLGGSLEVESTAGVGSTFLVTIPTGPLVDTPFLEPTFDAAHPDTNSSSELPELSCKLLLVDDRRDVRYVAQHFLEGAGAAVITKEDGQQALEAVEDAKVRGEAFDIIVMDMQMPVMDGFTAVSELRARGFDLPIIALTAAAMQGDRERCLDAGCDDYLSKPLDANSIVAMVEKLTQKQSHAELAALRKSRWASHRK